MRRLILAAIVVLAGGVSARAVDKDKWSVQYFPPAVVKTVPEAGDTKVDPSITEIQVTFRKNGHRPKLFVGGRHRLVDERQTALAARRQDLRHASETSAGKNVCRLAQYGEVRQL